MKTYEFNFRHAEFEVSVRYASCSLEWLFGNKDLELKNSLG